MFLIYVVGFVVTATLFTFVDATQDDAEREGFALGLLVGGVWPLLALIVPAYLLGKWVRDRK